MKKQILIVASLALSISTGLTGCMTQEETGTVLGGIAGGVVGAQIGSGSGRDVAIVAGTLLGAYIGREIGRQMDADDQWRLNNALDNNSAYETTSWRNADSGYEYAVTPTTRAGTCREYRTEAIIDGRRETVYGTACRGSDGKWRATS
jgi:surface antigen